MMILHQVPMPENRYSYGEETALEPYEVERIPAAVAEAWYWYASGSYEGSGAMICRGHAGEWWSWNLGHCSCYGPTEHMGVPVRPFTSFDDLVASFSGDYERLEMAPLIAAIKAQAVPHD
jgi:hypothetical protein